MQRVGEKLFGSSYFHHVTGVHNIDPVGRLPHHSQGVGDEDDGDVLFLHQLMQQPQDLVLDGDIQGGARLVGDEQFPAGDQGHGDADPLSHPAAELDRVAIQHSFWIGHGHLFQGDDSLFPNFLSGQLFTFH